MTKKLTFFLFLSCFSIGLFSTAIGEDDLKSIMNDGLGKALGLTPVEPASKLAATWGKLKEIRP